MPTLNRFAAMALLSWSLSAAFDVRAFDGWQLESTTPISGRGSSWDYLALDEKRDRLFIGHRAEGLRVFDLHSKKIIKVIDQTEAGSSNGATLMPEFDLGVSNNQNGTLTPFRLSSLEALPVIALGAGMDTSHYDAKTRRLVVNMDADGSGSGSGTDLVVLQAPSLAIIGKIRVPTRKPEHAASDGKGNLFIAARDVDKVFRLDLNKLVVTDAWPTPGCGQTNGLDMDTVGGRIFLGCRGRADVAPSFVVMNASTGAVLYKHPIGGGNDGLIYDPDLKRIFLANSVNAVLQVFEQIDVDNYRPLEAMGTAAAVRTIALDSRTKKIYSFTAQSSADYAKPIATSVSSFYANTFFADTFAVLAYSRKPQASAPVKH